VICENEQNQSLSSAPVRKCKADTDDRYFNTNISTDTKIVLIKNLDKYIHYKFQNCSSDKSLVSFLVLYRVLTSRDALTLEMGKDIIKSRSNIIKNQNINKI